MIKRYISYFKINNFIFIFFIFFVFLFNYNQALALTITPVKMEISGDPGQVLSTEMTLINERDVDETYYASFSNFEPQGESGTPNFVNSNEGISTWITTPESVFLPANTSKIVHVKITIPENADPGGHFGVVFWGTQPPDNNGGNVSIGFKTGMLVLLRVNGDINDDGGILEFATKDGETFFTSLPISFYYRFQNSGNDRLKPEGEIIMQNVLGYIGARVDANPVEGNILPASTRKIETVWQGRDGVETQVENRGFFDQAHYEWRNFAFGYYKAKLVLHYGLDNQEVAKSYFNFWVVPWHLLILITVLLVFIWIIFKFGLHKYNKWLISQVMSGAYKKNQDEN